MFDEFLSCSAFWLPSDNKNAYVELARNWSGAKSDENIERLSGGAIRWSRLASVTLAGHSWFSSPPTVKCNSFQAIIPVGKVADSSAFVFVAPFASVAASFKTALCGKVSEAWQIFDRGGFELDVRSLKYPLVERGLSAIVVGIEGKCGESNRAAFDVTLND